MMDTQQEIVASRIAAKDLITDLERVILRVRKTLIQRPARELYAASPELFEVNHAIVKAHTAAATAKAELLRVLAMEPYTTFLRSTTERR